MKKVILRADGNSEIGLGHVYRLLALAEMLKHDFMCVFAINKPENFVLDEIEKSCSSCIVLNNEVCYKMPDLTEIGEEIKFDLAEHLSGKEIVVTDGYLFKEKYQMAVRSTGAKLVCVDDLVVNRYIANAVINHAPGIDTSLYKIEVGTILLTGLKYAMIRQPFFKPFPGRDGLEKNVFISLGGSDYFRYTKKIVEFLLQANEFKHLHVLTSSSFSSSLISDLNDLESQYSKLKLYYNLKADELVSVMDKCTHAFVAASTILIEAFSRGLICFTGYYVTNQQYVYSGFTTQKLAIGLGNLDRLDMKAIAESIKLEKEISPIATPLSSSEIIKTFHLLCEAR